MIVFISTISTSAFAHWHGGKDASWDARHKSFGEGYSEGMRRFDDGFMFFPGGEIGMGSGALTGALGINVGYKTGLFFIGTSIKGQVVNIDRVNYSFMPYTLNICGLSYSVLPETTNSQNDRKLKGQSIGFAMGGKFTIGQMTETDPDTDSEQEFLVFTFGFGF